MAEEALVRFLNDHSDTAVADSVERVHCEGCYSSRHLYCPTCLSILVPKSQWPRSLEFLRLPFDIDIILDDRRASSTGVQTFTMLSAVGASAGSRLFDLEQGDGLPEYADGDGTFLLFPDNTSESLSKVLEHEPIHRLVLLDCKWQRVGKRHSKLLSRLRKVHLDQPPSLSLYWRWHNAGNGMLSSIEALYYAAWETAECRQWTDREPLTGLFWLFALQRALIDRDYDAQGKHAALGRPSPVTEDGKEFQRSLRQLQGIRYKQSKGGVDGPG